MHFFVKISEKVNQFTPVATAFFATIFYFLFAGYKFAVSDEGGWIAYLNKRQDPSLYENDYLWSAAANLPQEKFSIFSDIDFLISSAFSFNFPLTHFVLIFVTKFLLFLLIYIASLKIFKNKSVAMLAILAFIPSYFLAGPLIGTNENNFIPRVLVQPFILAAVISAILGNWILTGFLTGFSVSIHAVSALPAIFGIFLVALTNIKSQNKTKLILTFFAFFIGVLPLTTKLVLASESSGSALNFGQISAYLKSVVIARKGYLLLSTWNSVQWRDTLAVFALSLPFLFFLKDKIISLKSKILVFYLGIIAANFAYFITTDIFSLGIFLSLQFPRSIAYIYLVNLILLSGTIIYFFEKKYFFSFLAGTFLIFGLYLGEKQLFYILLLFFILFPFLEKSQKITLPQIIINPSIIFLIGAVFFLITTFYTILTQYSAEKIYGAKITKLLWREFLFDKIHFAKPAGDISFQLQDWVVSNTKKDAVILVDPDLGFFRIYSKRAVVFDHKDLGYVYHSDELARKIAEREKDVADFEDMTEERIKELKNKYNISYLVWKETRAKLNFEKVYNQFGFTIYKLQ